MNIDHLITENLKDGTLDLSNKGITLDHVKALASHPSLKNVSWLNLFFNEAINNSDEARKILEESENFKNTDILFPSHYQV